VQYFGDEAQFSVIRKRFVDPKAEVYQPNYTGQLPLHIAAQNVKYIEEIDGSKQRMEAAYQTAPDLCTLLLTGLDPRNGDKVFSVERDAKGYAIPCMYQDGTGMTPLHTACMARTSLSYEIVARYSSDHPTLNFH
jgi:ankyrin repeat protein